MMKIRNVAIIAHVDHGKTSLVNELLKQGGVFRSNQAVEDRVMDSGALERERGITILAKNASIKHGDYKINIVDTPGHADFGGEVERALKMVDGVLLVVDAYEGPMPQTRFVLTKALELNHKVIVVVNKIDRPDGRLKEVADEVLELLIDLNANEEQLNSPVVYASARHGHASLVPSKQGTDMQCLLDLIVKHIPSPKVADAAPFKMLISATESNEFVGKLGIGKIESGQAKFNAQVALTDFTQPNFKELGKITSLFVFEGMKRVPVDVVSAGDIVCVSGMSNIQIGQTLSDASHISTMPFVKISPPSVEMTFCVNDSPFAGKEGKYVTSRHLRNRLYKEMEKDLSLKVYDTQSTESFRVAGRGEMHFSILIENMRREGYEFAVGTPKVLFKEEAGKTWEPLDRLVADVPESCVGIIMQQMGERKGELITMTPQGSRIRLDFDVPSRGLFGFKSQFLTQTKGEGIYSTVPNGYCEYKGEIQTNPRGSLVAFESDVSVIYGLYNAQDHGDLYIGAGVPVYQGMVVGMHAKQNDLVVNVCKKKQLSNMRSSSSDEALRLTPPRQLTLEECIELVKEDEWLEVTPKSLRLRKKKLTKK